jgi:hypothetical protein
MQFPPFEHLHYYENVHGIRRNISYSHVRPFSLGEFRRRLPETIDLNWTDPDGPAELRRLIARRHRVPAGRVLVTTGATEANFLANAALLRAGDRAIVDSPTYTPLRDCPMGFGAEVVPVPRNCQEDWTLDLDRFAKAAKDGARLFVFANLNNPTSAGLAGSDIEELADLAEERDAYVLVDETFRELAFDRAPPSVAGFGPRMIALSTVTKVCGLGALRVGWIVASEDLLAQFRRVKDYTTICGSSLTQLLAQWALERWDLFLKRARRILDRNRKIVREALARTPHVRGEIPSGGTVLFPHSDVDVGALSELLLRKYRTVIAHGRFFDLGDHFRLGIGGDSEELQEGLDRLRMAVRRLAG